MSGRQAHAAAKVTACLIFGSALSCTAQPVPLGPGSPSVAAETRSAAPCTSYPVGSSCCAGDYGFDTESARTSCAFSRYLGESEELSCVHSFEGESGEIHKFFITPLVGTSMDAAAQGLARSGLESATDHRLFEDGVQLWSHPGADLSWALLPGWPTPRRLAWSPQACEVKELSPVLEAMLHAPPGPEGLQPIPSLSPTLAPASVLPDSLLAAHADPVPALGHYPLPRSAELLVDELLRAAAHSDWQAFAARVGPNARWGLPDRREIGGRPIRALPPRAVNKGGAGAMELLRLVAARLEDQPLRCALPDRRVTAKITRGEDLLWCLWSSADQLDLLVFGLRGSASAGQADARLAYLGLFPSAPSEALRVEGEPPPPPLVPAPELRCGDPHAPADERARCPSSGAGQPSDKHAAPQQ